MSWKDNLKMVAALIIITIGFGCWWWLGQEGYTRPAQRVIIVNGN